MPDKKIDIIIFEADQLTISNYFSLLVCVEIKIQTFGIISHWTYLLWIHSNYNTHCLYHFENPAIVAIKSDIFTFIHVKSIKVTSGFNLRRIKKSARGHWHAKKSKTNLKTLVSPLLIRPQGSQGCQKMRQDPLNMQQEVWCAKIAPNLKNIQKSLRKQGFFDIFSSILMFFEVCVF